MGDADKPKEGTIPLGIMIGDPGFRGSSAMHNACLVKHVSDFNAGVGSNSSNLMTILKQ